MGKEFIVTGFFSFHSTPISVQVPEEKVKEETRYLIEQDYVVGVLEVNAEHDELAKAVSVFGRYS